ncbi:MAG: T9SS type A sorting domain-containing protein [Bacteroidia bacterium]|nr:T9SS type A sorting domain-containing protein [Bacteroidia bacterium]
MKYLLFLNAYFFGIFFVQGQVEVDPFFPTADEQITVIFDARKGDQGLKGFAGDVYGHIGLITSQSANDNDWRYVQGEWGVAFPKTKLTSLGNDLYSISFKIRDFFGVPQNETVQKLVFVFRNVDGTKTGRTVGGGDIYYDVYSENSSLLIVRLDPSEDQRITSPGEQFQFRAAISKTANLTLTDNGTTIYSATGKLVDFNISSSTSGSHEIILTATSGSMTESIRYEYFVIENGVSVNPPAGIEDGINYTSDTSVILQVHAPGKNSAFVIGSFNGWNISTSSQMTRSVNGQKFWLLLDELEKGEDYFFQYLIDGITIADPYSELILDPDNDSQIFSSTFPDLPDYPQDASGIVTWISMDTASYDWEVIDLTPVAKTDLVIYELLIRDFLSSHNYNDLKDTLDYLENLGVNAIELMPVQEFENNNSWGYNPSFHMALDKYYGTPEAFKDFIDEAHSRGIAVILDVVYNHAFGQSPLARLYFDSDRPATDNPWLNTEAKHDFNVGYDFNHESPATKQFVKKVMKHWLTEFNIDGFRFDLSKGFTQNNTLGDITAWGQYDQSRIDIWKEYADFVWSLKSNALLILEHFSENLEQKALSDYGFMLWGNMNHNFNEASMGYLSNSDITGASYIHRNWADPHLIAYMESHDEERLMYKNLEFGNSNGGYSVQSINTALLRQSLVTTFFYTIPGPKMLWQFGELGYDYSINTCTNGSIGDCRLDRKPIRWDYLNAEERRYLRDFTAALIQIKQSEPIFETDQYEILQPGSIKFMKLMGNGQNALVVGNFDVENASQNIEFQHAGDWYEYFSGDTLTVDQIAQTIELAPGTFKLYTDYKLDESGNFTVSSKVIKDNSLDLKVFPNPSPGTIFVSFFLDTPEILSIKIYDSIGQLVQIIPEKKYPSGHNELQLDQRFDNGMFILQISNKVKKTTSKFLIQKE